MKEFRNRSSHVRFIFAWQVIMRKLCTVFISLLIDFHKFGWKTYLMLIYEKKIKHTFFT